MVTHWSLDAIVPTLTEEERLQILQLLRQKE